MWPFSIFRRGPKGPSNEEKVLTAFNSLHRKGIDEAWGFRISQEVERLFPPKHWWQRMSTATLYHNLHTMEEKGILKSRRDDDPSTPRRRMYRLAHSTNPV